MAHGPARQQRRQAHRQSQRAKAEVACCPSCEGVIRGNYCSTCGQNNGEAHLSVHALWHDFLHDYLHLDSKLPQTARYLLTRPGFLTREYLAGKRSRYLRPFHVYVLSSLLFFLTFAASSEPAAHVAMASPVSASAINGAPDPEPVFTVGGTKFYSKRLARLGADAKPFRAAIRRDLFDVMSKVMLLLITPLVALLLFWLYRGLFLPHLIFALHFGAASYVLLALGQLPFVGFSSVLAVWLYLYLAIRRVTGA